MGVHKWGEWFDGPYHTPEEIRADSGVYVVTCGQDPGAAVLDVGQSDDVRERIASHDREDCWRKNCPEDEDLITYWVHYMTGPDYKRITLELNIRASAKPLCGER